MSDEESSISVKWIVIATMMLIAILGWGVAASLYASNVLGFQAEMMSGRSATGRVRPSLMNIPYGIMTFLYLAFTQLQNLPWVLGYVFKNHFWLPITVIVVEGMVLAGGFGLKKLENELEGPKKPRRKSKTRKKKRRK